MIGELDGAVGVKGAWYAWYAWRHCDGLSMCESVFGWENAVYFKIRARKLHLKRYFLVKVPQGNEWSLLP